MDETLTTSVCYSMRIVTALSTTHFEITPTNTLPGIIPIGYIFLKNSHTSITVVTFEICYTPSPPTVAVEQGTATFRPRPFPNAPRNYPLQKINLTLSTPHKTS